MTEEYERLTDDQLNEELVALEDHLSEGPAGDRFRNLAQNLRIHQIELEMQNRELREAQSALEEARDRYADLYDFAPIGYLTLDAQGVTKELNLTAAHMLGRPRAELLDKPLASRLERGQSQAFFRHLRRAFDDDAKTTAEIALTTDRGEMRWYLLESVRKRTDGTTVCRTAMIDVTARRAAEQARHESERRLALIADNVPVLISYVDHHMCYGFVNAAYREWFAVDPQEAIGRRVNDLMNPDVVETLKPFAERALAGEEVTYEYTVTHRRRGKRDVSAHLVPDRDDDGNTKGYFSVIVDITERKRAEEQEKRRLLEAAHADRLSTMGEMTTEIAHELNQPLSAIATTADVCLQRANQLPENQGDGLSVALGEISTQAHRVAQVVKQIRTFARRHQPELASVDLQQIIDTALNLIRIEARANDITVDAVVHGPAIVEADAVLVEQLVVNLARNAMEAMMATGTVDPRVTLATAESNGSVEVTINDNGPGLSGKLDQLFEPFYTTKVEGMGLGLAIARSIAEAHGGRIWGENLPEDGARFGFNLNQITNNKEEERPRHA